MTAFSWPAVLSVLMRGEDLPRATTALAMDEIMAGEATAAQLAAFAVLLRVKGETADELGGLVDTMLARAVPVGVDPAAVDVVGTGGDRAQTVNISTMASMVVAATDRRVVKHGNRAASSACGSADVLEQLGVAIELGPEGVATTVAEVGIGFCFAARFHSGTRHAVGPRREMGVPTVFNFLGPLTNPGRPAAAAVGCAELRMAPVMASVLAGRGDSALVFRGDDGLDELTTTTTSQVWLVRDGTVTHCVLDPAALGIAAAPPDALRGGDRAVNAAVVHEVLAGRPGPVRDAVLLNAAAGVVAFDALPSPRRGGRSAAILDEAGLHDALGDALAVAADAIDSGAAADLLARWVAVSSDLS